MNGDERGRDKLTSSTTVDEDRSFVTSDSTNKLDETAVVYRTIDLMDLRLDEGDRTNTRRNNESEGRGREGDSLTNGNCRCRCRRLKRGKSDVGRVGRIGWRVRQRREAIRGGNLLCVTDPSLALRTLVLHVSNLFTTKTFTSLT